MRDRPERRRHPHTRLQVFSYLLGKLVQLCRQKGLDEVILVVGGVIPTQDIPALKELGVDGVFPGGTPFEELIAWLKEKTAPKAEKAG